MTIIRITFLSFIAFGLPLQAAKITPFVDIKEFIENSNQIVIAKCLSVEPPTGFSASVGDCFSRVKVTKLLKGQSIHKEFQVQTQITLVSGGLYMFALYNDIDPKRTFAYDELCAVQIKNGLPSGFEKWELKEQIQQIFAERLADLKEAEEMFYREKSSLRKALKNVPPPRQKSVKALQKNSEEPELHEKWLTEKLSEATSIKPGTEKSVFLKTFDEEGGLQPLPADRFVLKTCPMIKVKAHFKNEVLLDISQPYLEGIIVD